MKVTSDTKQKWTLLRIDINASTIDVFINGEIFISKQDIWFGGLGGIYLHTFGTHAQFRNFRVYGVG